MDLARSAVQRRRCTRGAARSAPRREPAEDPVAHLRRQISEPRDAPTLPIVEVIEHAGLRLDEVFSPSGLERIAQRARSGTQARRRAVRDAAPDASRALADYLARDPRANQEAMQFLRIDGARIAELIGRGRAAMNAEATRAFLLIDARLVKRDETRVACRTLNVASRAARSVTRALAASNRRTPHARTPLASLAWPLQPQRRLTPANRVRSGVLRRCISTKKDDERDPFEVVRRARSRETDRRYRAREFEARRRRRAAPKIEPQRADKVKTGFSWAGFAGGLAALVWIAGAIGGPLSYFGVDAVMAMDPAMQAGLIALAFGPALLFWVAASAAGEALKARQPGDRTDAHGAANRACRSKPARAKRNA